MSSTFDNVMSAQLRSLASALRPMALAFVLLAGAEASAAEWNGKDFQDDSTLEFKTVASDGDEHWSTVWLVVLDGEVYLNLGSRAVERLRTNATAPFVSVRAAGKEFDRIRVEPAQDRQKDVAAAIADKYWTGFLVPHRPPSTVVRLRPE